MKDEFGDEVYVRVRFGQVCIDFLMHNEEYEMPLTPKKARKLASLLNQGADRLDPK